MCTQHRNPFHCILPPYMTDKLQAKTNKSDSEPGKQFRDKRRLLATIPPVKKKASMATAGVKPISKIYRELYDAGQMPLALGKLIWKEGQRMPTGDKDAKNVITGAGNVWNFYKNLFNRNSLDNHGLPLIQTIRYRENPNEPFYNAFWDGEQMFYGTGDARYTNSFTADLDIIGHELTHGVVDFEAQLEYKNQSGALNESYADVFGITIKQWVNKTASRKADWLIGSNVLKGKNALRSMKAPGTAFKNDPIFGDDPQAATMSGYQKLPDTEDGDYGGVHINSGIPNYAYYVACFEINGNAWEKAGPVWYAALTDRKLLKKTSNFADAAAATLKTATTQFGKNSLEVKAVEKGWKEAGVI